MARVFEPDAAVHLRALILRGAFGEELPIVKRSRCLHVLEDLSDTLASSGVSRDWNISSANEEVKFRLTWR
jgi:hypothetical protein